MNNPRGLTGVSHLFGSGGLAPDFTRQPTQAQLDRAHQNKLHSLQSTRDFLCHHGDTSLYRGLRVDLGSDDYLSACHAPLLHNPASTAPASAYSSSYDPSTAPASAYSSYDPASTAPASAYSSYDPASASYDPESSSASAYPPMVRPRPSNLNLLATALAAPDRNAAEMHRLHMESQMRALFDDKYDHFSKTENPDFMPDFNLGDDAKFDEANAFRWRRGGTRKRNRKNVSKHKRKCQSRKKPLRKRK